MPAVDPATPRFASIRVWTTRRLPLRAVLALTALSLLPLQAVGQQHVHAIGARVGTAGPGIEYTFIHRNVPRYALRANYNYGTYTRGFTRDGIRYDGTYRFNNVVLSADALPFDNGFRVSAGAMLSFNKGVATGRPVVDPVVLNGRAYPASAVESANGEATIQPVAPYFAIGWGVPARGARRYYISFDLGVMYQRPGVSLGVVCGPALSAAQCDDLRDDVRAEERDLRADLVKGKFWPMLNVGVGWRF